MSSSPEFEKFLSKDKSENVINKCECDTNIKDKMWDVIKEDSNLCIRIGKVYCMACSQYFETFNAKHGKQTILEQVKNTAKHQLNVRKNPNKRKSTEDLTKIATNTKNVSREEFFTDLRKAFMCADIPFEKLNNDALRKFVLDNTTHNPPHSSTLRKGYIRRYDGQNS